ncbi:MAG: hydrogenase 2 operon protein HybA [Anaerolineales bacterium]
MCALSRRDFCKVAGLALGAALTAPQSAFAAAPDTNPDEFTGMLYDATMCVGCNACTMACRDWNGTTPETDDRSLYDAPTELSAHTWTLIQLYQGTGEYSFVKHQCMHCIDPGCVSGCPVHALRKEPTGAVSYDPERCIGCRYCMYTCPFHVPRFTWDERIPVIAKCTLCNDRLTQGLGGPACAERCPTGALTWGKRGDLRKEAHRRIEAEPDRYVNHIYGEYDAGGTGVLYLAGVGFDKLGFENLGTDPAPKLSEDTANVVLPVVFVGGAIGLAVARFASKRNAWEDSWPV